MTSAIFQNWHTYLAQAHPFRGHIVLRGVRMNASGNITDITFIPSHPSSSHLSSISPPLKACGDPGMCKMGGKWIAWPLELLSPLQQAALPVLSQQCAHSIRLMDSAGI